MSASGSGRVEFLSRTKNTLASLLVLARTGTGEAARSTRQISMPWCTAMRVRVRVTGAWPTALIRCVVSQLTKPSPFWGFTRW